MNIHDFKDQDIIQFIDRNNSWITRFKSIDEKKLYIYDLAINEGVNYDGLTWGNIGSITTCRYATPEEIEMFTKIEKERGIEIPITELYPIW